MPADDDQKRSANLELLSRVAATAGNHCFHIRANATLVALLVGVSLTMGDVNALVVPAYLCPWAVLWWLDGSYLRQERAYQRRYEEVRTGVRVPDGNLTLDEATLAKVDPLAVRFASVVPLFHASLLFLVAGLDAAAT